MKSTREKGELGEKRAKEYLVSLGYTVLTTNFFSSFGEIDIVGMKENVVVFFEVKSWSTFGTEELERSVNKKKLRRIQKTAEEYRRKFPQYEEKQFQFDLIFIDISNNEVKHYENIFL